MTTTIDDILTSHRTHRAVVMGVLNVTPDSFSDGGAFDEPARAADRARQMTAEGANVIDIGAESTRPGSDRVSPDDQIARLADSVAAAAATGAIVSIDTPSAKVAAHALDQGAGIINDVSAGRDDPEILSLAAERGCPLILMHMLGRPKTMQANPHYEDVVAEVKAFLAERIAAAAAAGVKPERIIVDPGIGFGKLLEHNLSLLAGVPRLLDLGRPVLIGASRKRFIGDLTGSQNASERMGGSLAAALATWSLGASIFRVHDVAATVQALTVAQAIPRDGTAGNSTS